MSQRWWFASQGSTTPTPPTPTLTVPMPNYVLRTRGPAGPIADDRIFTVAGTDYPYQSDVRVTVGDGLVKAWLTLKPYPEGVYAADPGTLQKIVTITDAPGTGQITGDGAVSGFATIRFDITAANTAALGPRDYIFDVKVKTAAGYEYPAARGIWSNSGATTLSV